MKITSGKTLLYQVLHYKLQCGKKIARCSAIFTQHGGLRVNIGVLYGIIR